jgi:hypothetical protein
MIDGAKAGAFASRAVEGFSLRFRIWRPGGMLAAFSLAYGAGDSSHAARAIDQGGLTIDQYLPNPVYVYEI